jgi:hypothetical protein
MITVDDKIRSIERCKLSTVTISVRTEHIGNINIGITPVIQSGLYTQPLS